MLAHVAPSGADTEPIGNITVYHQSCPKLLNSVFVIPLQGGHQPKHLQSVGLPQPGLDFPENGQGFIVVSAGVAKAVFPQVKVSQGL